jgi:hypothetical protein
MRDAEDSRVRSGWGLWLTAPHAAWWMVEHLFPTKRAALERAQNEIAKGCVDGAIIRRVTLGPVTEIEK